MQSRVNPELHFSCAHPPRPANPVFNLNLLVFMHGYFAMKTNALKAPAQKVQNSSLGAQITSINHKRKRKTRDTPFLTLCGCSELSTSPFSSKTQDSSRWLEKPWQRPAVFFHCQVPCMFRGVCKQNESNPSTSVWGHLIHMRQQWACASAALLSAQGRGWDLCLWEECFVFCIIPPPKFAWPHETFSSKSISTDIGTDRSSDVYERRYFQDPDQPNKTQSASLKVWLQIISPNFLKGMRFLARQTGILGESLRCHPAVVRIWAAFKGNNWWGNQTRMSWRVSSQRDCDPRQFCS